MSESLSCSLRVDVGGPIETGGSPAHLLVFTTPPIPPIYNVPTAVELRFTKGGSVHSRVGRDCWDMRIINRLGCVLLGDGVVG